VALTDSAGVAEGCWEYYSILQNYGHVILLKIFVNNTETLRAIPSADKMICQLLISFTAHNICNLIGFLISSHLSGGKRLLIKYI
jgi:hypothetical protein